MRGRIVISYGGMSFLKGITGGICRVLNRLRGYLGSKQWCPQHGYPEPCVKCNGMTVEEWDKFFESLRKAVSDDRNDEPSSDK